MVGKGYLLNLNYCIDVSLFLCKVLENALLESDVRVAFHRVVVFCSYNLDERVDLVLQLGETMLPSASTEKNIVFLHHTQIDRITQDLHLGILEGVFQKLHIIQRISSIFGRKMFFIYYRLVWDVDIQI